MITQGFVIRSLNGEIAMLLTLHTRDSRPLMRQSTPEGDKFPTLLELVDADKIPGIIHELSKLPPVG